MVRISRIEDYLELRHSDYRGIKLFSGHYRVRNRNRYAASHEPDLVTFLELLPEGAVFWDVGANVGFFSIFAARRGILSLAFEPDQLTCGVLNKNIYLNAVSESCVALPIALNDERMIDVLNMKEFLPANAYNTFGRDKNERGAEFVPTFKQGAVGIPADELPLGPGLAKFAQPDFVKIDVDGNELKVIRGMRERLGKTSFLCVELADDHPEMPDTRDEIASLGFKPMDDPRIVDHARLGNTIRNHYFRNASGPCSLRS